jgi:membrane protein
MATEQSVRAPQVGQEPDRPGNPGAEPGHLSVGDYSGILRRAFSEFRRHNLTTVAAALAYYAFLAIPSVLMVAVGVFGLVSDPGGAKSLVDRLSGVMPAEAQTLLRNSLAQVTNHSGTGVTILVIGSVLALWSLTGAMQNVMWGLNIAYGREETRGFVRKRITALTMVTFAGAGVLLVFGLLVLGPHVTTWISDATGHTSLVRWIWWTAQWPILLAGLLVAFAGILYLGPNVADRRFRLLSLGAVLAIVLFLILSGAFAFYASRFGSYNKTWGSLSAVVVMLTWLWLSSVALLFGAEVNAEVERRTQRLAGNEPA